MRLPSLILVFNIHLHVRNFRDMRRLSALRGLRDSISIGRKAQLQLRLASTQNQKPQAKEPVSTEPYENNPGYGDWSEINPDAKTIDTAVGPLPISPILDPSWQKARQRDRKKSEPKKTGLLRFQRRTRENPYGEPLNDSVFVSHCGSLQSMIAQLLAGPVRICHVTRTRLPNAFLQGFGLVRHPESAEVWWIPGDFQPTSEEAVLETSEEAESPDTYDATRSTGGDTISGEPAPPAEPAPSTEAIADATPAVSNSGPIVSADEAAADGDDANGPVPSSRVQEVVSVERNGKFSAPGHTLARQDLLQAFFDKKSKYNAIHMRVGLHPNIANLAGAANWREDMHEVIRDQFRRQIVDELIYLSRRCETDGPPYFVKLDTTNPQKTYQKRSCILSFGDERKPFDVLQTEGVPGSAVPVYDLPRLLGPERVHRMASESAVFRDVSMLLLKGSRTVKLNQKLWRLQGYLADYQQLQ